MWKAGKRFFVMLALALLCLCCLSGAGSCSEVAEKAEETISVSRTDWEKLKSNNAAQREALSALWTELLEARTARQESDQALSEARSLLEASQMTSDEMMQKLIQLLSEAQMQKDEIARLKSELAAAKNESRTAYESIVRANQYLSDTKAEIEAQRAEWQKREAKLERQRLMWQIVSALCAYGGSALAK